MKRNDWILIILIIVGMGVCFLFTLSGKKSAGQTVTVMIDGVERGSYSLTEDRTVTLDTGNTFCIRDGKVFMQSATCPDQYCVSHKEICADGETIICLPHKVVIEIRSTNGAEYDAISE